jgi:hypothetical protein
LPFSSLHSTINKYFITIKYFCLLLLKRGFLLSRCFHSASHLISFSRLFIPLAHSDGKIVYVCMQSCCLTRVHCRHSYFVLIGQFGIWKCFGLSDKQFLCSEKISWLKQLRQENLKIYFGIVANERRRKKMSQDGKISSVSI